MSQILDQINPKEHSQTDRSRKRQVRATVSIPHISESRYMEELKKKNYAIIASLKKEKTQHNR